jgi:hypothetical protein
MMEEALTALAADTWSREAFISAVASLTAALACSMPSFNASVWALMRTSIWESSAIEKPIFCFLFTVSVKSYPFTLPPEALKVAISSSGDP